MSNLSREQREVLAFIDAILAMLEKNPNDNLLNVSLSLNPFDYLVDLITKFVKKDDMIEWLVNILVVSLPNIELGIKGVLLANLKATIDCNNDPRIPNWIRKKRDGYENFPISFNSERDRGLLFNLRNIDYNNIFSVSPLSKEGLKYYFGSRKYYVIDTDELRKYKYADYESAARKCYEKGIGVYKIKEEGDVDSVYDLARANDFNAFLWFVIHKGYFPNTLTYKDLIKHANENSNFIINDKDNSNIFKLIEGIHKINSREQPFIGEGNVVINNNNAVSLCISNVVDSKEVSGVNGDNMYEDLVNNDLSPKECSFKIVPMSNDNKSVNWYINSGTFFNFLLPEDKKKPRNYDKDYPICNLQYLEKVVISSDMIYDCLRFTILPKPFVHLPQDGEPAWRIKRILFNSNGNMDKKGGFSVNVVMNSINNEKDKCTYEIVGGGHLIIEKDTGKYYLDIRNSQSNLEDVLYACYPGLTVYEFNYDFVMGMQLFDPVVAASKLLETVSNIGSDSRMNISGYLGVNKSETMYQMRVAEIVKNIIESTAYEVSDCFYTFDNAKYSKMIRDSELKRSKLHVIEKNGKKVVTDLSNSDAFDYLNNFDNNATLNENKETIKRAITQATANITEEVLPEDKYTIEKGIIEELIKGLVFVLVEQLISPKLVLLYEVNRSLMGQGYTKYNLEDFLKSIEGLLISIVKELRDLILQALLNWCLQILTELFNVLKDLLVKEQLEYYTRLIKGLLKACSFKTSKRASLEHELDKVDYADIDEIERPQESNC